MVQGQEKPVPTRREPEHGDPQERASFEVERTLCLADGQPPALAFPGFRRQRFEIDHPEGPRTGLLDPLHRRARPFPEAGAQRLVALDEAGEAGGQGRGRDLSPQLQGIGHVVGGVAGLQEIEEPQTLLGERERRRHIP